jgi:hypothetical protein
MITEEHVAHFRTFGFVILRAQLEPELLERLSTEMERAFRDALGASFDERPDPGGIAGHYLSVMSTERTPVSLDLVEQLHMVARRLLGADVLPTPAQAILFFKQAGWHDDTGFDVSAVKFAAYLEPLDASNGALRVLPGSHVQPFRAQVREFDSRLTVQTDDELVGAVERLPAYVCETRPGDVIAFDMRLHHASVRGRDRRQWTVSYYRDPVAPEEVHGVTANLLDYAEPWSDYDGERYPSYDPAWVAAVEETWRAPAIQRLRELGVLDAAARSAGGEAGA